MLHAPRFTTAEFPKIRRAIRDGLLAVEPQDTGEWQAQLGVPEGRMAELLHCSFNWQMPNDLPTLADIVMPQLPWADEHFRERVSGMPYNPPPSSARWASTRGGHSEHVDGNGQFSHTYPERMWCTKVTSMPPMGIRYAVGDLYEVVQLLRERPGTRQAFLPIWFPEDTGGSRQQQRVPCTLGYLFLLRDRRLHIAYYIRSCDYVRHFRDDVYLTARLAMWMRDHLEPAWAIRMGELSMHVGSMHAFERDLRVLQSAQRLDNGHS